MQHFDCHIFQTNLACVFNSMLIADFFNFEYPGTRVLEDKQIEYSSIWASSTLESLLMISNVQMNTDSTCYDKQITSQNQVLDLIKCLSPYEQALRLNACITIRRFVRLGPSIFSVKLYLLFHSFPSPFQ